MSIERSINHLADAITLLARAINRQPEQVVAAVQDQLATAVDELVLEETPAVEPEPITKQSLTARCLNLVRQDAGYKAKVVELLDGFGVKSISGLPDEHVLEFSAKLDEVVL